MNQERTFLERLLSNQGLDPMQRFEKGKSYLRRRGNKEQRTQTMKEDNKHR